VSTTEQEVQVPDVPPMPVAVQFASRGRHLSLERVTPKRIVDAGGAVHWTAGVTYDFQDGFMLRFPGEDTIADKFDPQTGQMLEQDAIEWLRSHPLYNVDRGFWEVAPLTPDPTDLMRTIMEVAVGAGNPKTRAASEERLAAIHEAEVTSWKRDVVLNACRVALAAIESHTTLSAKAEDEAPTPIRQAPAGPPIATRDEDGVLHIHEGAIDAAPHTATKPKTLGGDFRPDTAPPKET
jgi:hypothetical protein